VLQAEGIGPRLPNTTVSFFSIDRNGSGTRGGPMVQGITSTATSFTLPGTPYLDPGDWILVARQGSNSALAHVQLSSGDDTSLMLELKPGARLSGRVVFEGRRSAPPMSDVRLDVQGAGPEAGLTARIYSPRPITPSADGVFAIPDLFGTIELGATPPPGWTLKSVVVAGHDILGDPLTLESGRNVSGVQIVFSDEVASVLGTTTARAGVPAPACEVALFPDDPIFHYNARRIRRVRADQNGRFRILDVPSGRYFAAAVPDIDGSTWLTSDVLDQLRYRATAITLGDREQKVVSLTCASAP